MSCNIHWTKSDIMVRHVNDNEQHILKVQKLDALTLEYYLRHKKLICLTVEETCRQKTSKNHFYVNIIEPPNSYNHPDIESDFITVYKQILKLLRNKIPYFDATIPDFVDAFDHANIYDISFDKSRQYNLLNGFDIQQTLLNEIKILNYDIKQNLLYQYPDYIFLLPEYKGYTIGACIRGDGKVTFPHNIISQHNNNNNNKHNDVSIDQLSELSINKLNRFYADGQKLNKEQENIIRERNSQIINSLCFNQSWSIFIEKDGKKIKSLREFDGTDIDVLQYIKIYMIANVKKLFPNINVRNLYIYCEYPTYLYYNKFHLTIEYLHGMENKKIPLFKYQRIIPIDIIISNLMANPNYYKNKTFQYFIPVKYLLNEPYRTPFNEYINWMDIRLQEICEEYPSHCNFKKIAQLINDIDSNLQYDYDEYVDIMENICTIPYADDYASFIDRNFYVNYIAWTFRYRLSIRKLQNNNKSNFSKSKLSCWKSNRNIIDECTRKINSSVSLSWRKHNDKKCLEINNLEQILANNSYVLDIIESLKEKLNDVLIDNTKYDFNDLDYKIDDVIDYLDESKMNPHSISTQQKLILLNLFYLVCEEDYDEINNVLKYLALSKINILTFVTELDGTIAFHGYFDNNENEIYKIILKQKPLHYNSNPFKHHKYTSTYLTMSKFHKFEYFYYKRVVYYDILVKRAKNLPNPFMMQKDVYDKDFGKKFVKYIPYHRQFYVNIINGFDRVIMMFVLMSRTIEDINIINKFYYYKQFKAGGFLIIPDIKWEIGDGVTLGDLLEDEKHTYEKLKNILLNLKQPHLTSWYVPLDLIKDDNNAFYLREGSGIKIFPLFDDIVNGDIIAFNKIDIIKNNFNKHKRIWVKLFGHIDDFKQESEFILSSTINISKYEFTQARIKPNHIFNPCFLHGNNHKNMLIGLYQLISGKMLCDWDMDMSNVNVFAHVRNVDRHMTLHIQIVGTFDDKLESYRYGTQHLKSVSSESFSKHFKTIRLLDLIGMLQSDENYFKKHLLFFSAQLTLQSLIYQAI